MKDRRGQDKNREEFLKFQKKRRFFRCEKTRQNNSGRSPGNHKCQYVSKTKKNNMFQTALSMKRGKGKAGKHGMGRPLNIYVCAEKKA